MSSAEAINAGVGTVEVAPTVAGQLETLIPDRAVTGEVALRTMAVYLPEEPISINGEPYTFRYDEARLASAVNVVAELEHGNSQAIYPRQLVVELDPKKSVLELGEDSLPAVNKKNGEDSRLLLMPKQKGTAIHLTLPREVVSSELTVEGAAKLVTRSLNHDLFTGLEENFRARKSLRPTWRFVSIAAAMGTGEGIGIALADKATTMLEYGSAGLAVGALAAGTVIAFEDAVRFLNVGGPGTPGALWRWGIVKGREKVREAGIRQDLLKKGYNQGPIISLEAVGQEEETSSSSDA